MNWYKTAKKYNDYSQWFQSRISALRRKNIDPFDILKQYGIMADDILRWHQRTEYPVYNLSFEEAAKMTKADIDSREQARVERKIERSLGGRGRVLRERELKKKYVGQNCTLNGYPAKIESDEYGYPVIINTQGQRVGSTGGSLCPSPRSWNSISTHYPHFYGNIYTLKDNAEEIQRKIIEEESRSPHPVQKDILEILKNRLNELIQKSGQYKEYGQYYPFVDISKVKAVPESTMSVFP